MGMEERWDDIQEAIKPFEAVWAWALAQRGDEEVVQTFTSTLTGRDITLTVDDFRKLVKACTPSVISDTENEVLAQRIAAELMAARRQRREEQA